MSDPKLPTGTNYCKCSACGEYFGGVSAFDLHRTGSGRDRSCLAPAEVSDRTNQPLLKMSAKGYLSKSYGSSSVAA